MNQASGGDHVVAMAIAARPSTPIETRVAAKDLATAARRLLDEGGRMQMVYAWWPEPKKLELRYLVGRAGTKNFEFWTCRPARDGVPSLADIWPLIGWYEREITDLFGFVFSGHPEPRRLVLHENAKVAHPPFTPKAKDSPITVEGERRIVPALAGDREDVQLLPFGPVRSDVVESAEFLFFYVGEQILHYHPQLFFKHRGMEKRFEGLAPEAGVVMAERISGVGSLAHALAYCQAVEAAASCVVPKRAAWLRVLLAELERLYNHLHYLGHLADTTTLKVGQAEGKLLEERVKQLNAQLTGSRFLRGILKPGGLRRDLFPKDWLREKLEDVRREAARYAQLLDDTDSFLDRLISTGHLDRKVAFDQGATGPVDRASGVDRDLRRDHSYAAYAELPLTVAVETAGDAYARFKVRVAEIDTSLVMMQRVLLLLPEGPVATECRPLPGSHGLGWSESPRGTLFHAIHIGPDGRVARVKIKSPSFSNWRVFPFTVHDSNMMDYAINEASFGLTIAGCDR
ncbi:NADH-quinone oxidoreductase subunit C [Mesorhizobium sp. MSK_1335]|uniref:NADH-quinone oxidoreductase subunit C n=1 Tax=Mesorhizobium montanum TaxID=3072323 RepID=A0ABU4ZS38_9HYPH|nr:NADH-quinone oxidoreductase subunit C [Mesorhizobium sp. MSK_1335]MDX8528231.1 NADH-quinone oxidoreductase subunit C [Mesorhizobium sp. MSK_1335]